MGWKFSLIAIESNSNNFEDKVILEKLGFEDPNFIEKGNFEKAFNSRKYIGIGEINGNIIITDNYILNEEFINPKNKNKLSKNEKNIISLFPSSEIVTVACHSVVDFHGYSLIKNGEKVRSKTISSDDEIVEFGTPFEEELEIYKDSFVKDNVKYWNFDNSENEYDYYTESSLMEEFSFGVLKRRLGVLLNNEEGDAVLNVENFRLYKVKNKSIYEDTSSFSFVEEKKVSAWKRIVVLLIGFLIIQFVKQYFFKK